MTKTDGIESRWKQTRSGGPRPGRALCLALVGLACLAAASATAETQRVEAVGTYGIRESMRSKVIPRDEAVEQGLWEGVSRVALELMGEDPFAGGDETEGDALETLRRALGQDILPYTRSYRILDDKGESPVLFEEEPGVRVEYVIVVEVIVDVDRVVSALESANLIATDAGAGERGSVVVEIEGLSAYVAFEHLLERLRSELAATRIRTLEFARGRQRIEVTGPFDAQALATRLSQGGAQAGDDALVLEPLQVDVQGQRVRLLGRWFPASAEPESGKSIARSGNRR